MYYVVGKLSVWGVLIAMLAFLFENVAYSDRKTVQYDPVKTNRTESLQNYVTPETWEFLNGDEMPEELSLVDVSEEGERYYVTDDEDLIRRIKVATKNLKVLPDTEDNSGWDDCGLLLRFHTEDGQCHVIDLNGYRITDRKGQKELYYELENLEELHRLLEVLKARDEIENYD